MVKTTVIEEREYKGVVVYRAYKTMYVTAESKEEAEQLMQEMFSIHRAEVEMEVTDLEEINGLGGQE